MLTMCICGSMCVCVRVKKSARPKPLCCWKCNWVTETELLVLHTHMPIQVSMYWLHVCVHYKPNRWERKLKKAMPHTLFVLNFMLRGLPCCFLSTNTHTHTENSLIVCDYNFFLSVSMPCTIFNFNVNANDSDCFVFLLFKNTFTIIH